MLTASPFNHCGAMLDERRLLPGPLTEVKGVAGGRVLLPCDFDPPISNDSTHLVLFYHGGIGTPIYSVDARSVSVDRASHWAEESLGGRAYMKLDQSQRGLVLEEVQLEDEGDYRCRVDFLESPTRNIRIRLHVVVPPRSLTITTDYAPKSRVSRVAGPFPEGAEITLSCQVLGGHPRPQVTWWHEGSLLDDVSEVKTGQVTRNALSLPPLTRGDLNKTLTCQASNSDLTMPLSQAITIDMIYGPTWVGLETEGRGELRVGEGVARTVTCEAWGARPPAVIQWWLEGETLTHTTQVESGEVSRSTLTLVPEPRHHGLSLTCRASTPGLPHIALASSTKLAVLYWRRTETNDIHRGQVKNMTGTRPHMDMSSEGKASISVATTVPLLRSAQQERQMLRKKLMVLPQRDESSSSF
ncbi:hypothetical protein Pcinc_032206 [Petrolisthes cinctipes]|uniref:Ig-like domain-containing protein n=1 Tax=Petrolisthes cinctipes TaxID=88211 RepID=A0AAE1K1W3_PETCI|nr:hypothetical protein Pcinc_032206 [Petrolisthes cinctipes]